MVEWKLEAALEQFQEIPAEPELLVIALERPGSAVAIHSRSS
jgi:hypothetical protein